MKELTPHEAAKMLRLLEQNFPWIGEDEPVSGASVVDQIVNLHERLAKRSRES